MDGVARSPAEDRRALFQETAARLGVEATIAEKDFWVCWTLKRLYTLEGLPRILFKGGTSLSKCFGVIRRFSEDIDIGLERVDIGLVEGDFPAEGMGTKAIGRALDRLREKTRAYIAGEFMPRIQGGFRAALGTDCLLETQARGSETCVIFQYPQSLQASAYAPSRYIGPAVLLELGARSDHDPVEEVEIKPYAAEQFPGQFANPGCTVVAQARQRTLLEKALILHTDRARRRVSPRSSRHAYDLVMLHRFGAAELVTPELFRQVALHKRIFGEDTHAGRAAETGLQMVPNEDLGRDLERDYRAMQEMFFGDTPSFEEILVGLQELEVAINARR